jgi:hypothetical protein
MELARREPGALVGGSAVTLGEEVDFFVAVGRQFTPIEVRATARPRLRGAGPLRTLRAECGKAARVGLLLHTGSAIEWPAPDVLPAP